LGRIAVVLGPVAAAERPRYGLDSEIRVADSVRIRTAARKAGRAKRSRDVVDSRMPSTSRRRRRNCEEQALLPDEGREPPALR
jgi:hypothetical protein